MAKPSKRFPLLVYRALARRWFGPALWMIPAGVLLWWVASRFSGLATRYAPLALVISGVGTLIALYALLARRAGVRCFSDHFTIYTPLYPVAFAYRRIQTTRPTELDTIFPQQKEKGARRRLYQGLWHKTALVVDLKGYPLPRWWLKLWLSPYLFSPQKTGLVLLVEEWMALSRQLDEGRSTLARR